MLSHISQKFKTRSSSLRNEPRAALFLNRFTRTLTIMYATGGIEDVLGIPADSMRGRSFYYCISENCLPDAVKCLENAKGNNSIAYLRFWFRDPRLDDEQAATDNPSDDSDEEMTTDTSVDQDFEGGVQLNNQGRRSSASNAVSSDESMDVDSSAESAAPSSAHEAIFGQAMAAESSTSSLPHSPEERSRPRPANNAFFDPIEIEAVISCASDGLVVCLRRARPLLPTRNQVPYENGLFAAPWATEPMLPPMDQRQQPAHNTAFALGPQLARAHDTARVGGPDQHDYMNCIKEQAIFAWALTGINGALQSYGYGRPLGESVPEDGLPIWDKDPHADLTRSDSGPTNLNGVVKGGLFNRDRNIFGDPGLDRKSVSSGSASRSSTSRSMDGDVYSR